MLGGFLGAGKTTAIARIARSLIDAGSKVGLVTNDQAFDLVDTHSLRSQGFNVGEVAGACFCCRFDDLVATTQQLGRENIPDVIIAEPVGSCTDLVATVIEPLHHLHGDRFDIAPLCVLFKPEHGRKILDESDGLGFSPNAAYIFLKQIEEADLVVLNKIDKLDDAQRDSLLELIKCRFPGKRVLAVSARYGCGFDELVDHIMHNTRATTSTMEVDYNTYGDGEAELGWLNSRAHISNSKQPGDRFVVDDVLLAVVRRAREALHDTDAEPVHLKVLGMSDGATGIANLVSSAATAELSLASGAVASSADLVINARVASAPETLNRVIQQVIRCVSGPRYFFSEDGKCIFLSEATWIENKYQSLTIFLSIVSSLTE